MPARIIDGKAVADAVRSELRGRIDALRKRGVTPGLAAVLVGEDPASAVYVRRKREACRDLGVASPDTTFPSSTSEQELLRTLDGLNRDARIHGILTQLPLPDHIDEARVLEAIDPRKDVDGFHPENVGRLLQGRPRFVSATPLGVIELLLRTGHDPAGQRVVIVGRSNIVGKPLAALLVQKRRGGNATVTVAHTGTRDLARVTREAEILVAAAGSPGLVKADMVARGAVVIDVGISSVPDASKPSGRRLVGDVDFEGVRQVASAITPVPGGVGPMTIAMLLSNAVAAAEAAATRSRAL